ncbi:hypothetical protein FHW83_002129 [Duganella sp. SG902]|nr:hypothetical protein [Duganella sp. SG902]
MMRLTRLLIQFIFLMPEIHTAHITQNFTSSLTLK